MQAVVKIGSSQYLVTKGQQLLIDKVSATEGKLSFDQVLLLISDNSIQVGQPYLPGTQIKAKIMGSEKGDKIRVATYKAKSRYRKVKGFRPQFTRVLIEDIQTANTSPVAPKSKTRKTVKSAT